jgi:hypothetical protein
MPDGPPAAWLAVLFAAESAARAGNGGSSAVNYRTRRWARFMAGGL